ncbi:MAG TPA: outer membrane beta-barrel protein [Xanthobacteraceae bacterium]|nr:outer membrane beta-barrel protein [Xanthobacteraceae bacterium]
MGSLKRLALAGAAVIAIIPAARAADMPLPPAPPPVAYGGWYLRGDIGFSAENGGNFYETGLNPTPTSVENAASGFETGGIFRLGVGYQFNSWIRADVTGEYRTPASWSSFDITNSNGTLIPEHVTLEKSEIVALANVYLDLGTWWCVTPFIGAGAGFAGVNLSNFQETAPFTFNANQNPNPNPIMANNFAGGNTQWNFAWALHAGLAYKVTPTFSVELAYRYLNLGNAQSGAIIGFLNNPQNTIYHIDNITSQDLTLGVRWMLEPEQPPPAYPLVRKG